MDRGFDEAEGVTLRRRVPPASSTDAVKLLVNGRADLAVLDIHDLGARRAKRGADLVGVMALVQRPLAAVLAAPDVRRPRELEGARVGVTGLPSDDAVLRAIVAGDGGDPARARGHDRLQRGRRAPRPPGRRRDRVLERRGRRSCAAGARGSHVFRVDDYGAPPYPELVLCVTRADARRAPATGPRDGPGPAPRLRGGAAPTRVGGHALVERGAGDRAEVARELDAVSPAFAADGRPLGELDRRCCGAGPHWEARFGIVDQPPDVAAAFAFGLLGGSAGPGAAGEAARRARRPRAPCASAARPVEPGRQRALAHLGLDVGEEAPSVRRAAGRRRSTSATPSTRRS